MTFNKTLIRITLAIWTLLFLILCARTLFLKVDKHSVFPVFVNAGENWLHSQPLYVRGGTEEFRYSPLIAAFFVPFDLLPLKIGEFLWRSLNFFVFVGGLFYCCVLGLPRKFSNGQICAVFLLCIPLAVGSLNNAQSNPLVLGLLLIAVGAMLQELWTLCAIAITLATCFKLYPIALGLLLVLQFPRKMGWRLFVCITAATVIPFLMQRAAYVINQYQVWAHYLSTEDRQRGPVGDWYRDFRALWRIYVMPMKPLTYLIVELATAMAIAVVCLITRVRKMPMTTLLGFTFSLACCWMTVMGPATESATYILLAPTTAWGLVRSVIEKSRTRRLIYGIIFGLFVASQLALNLPNGKYFRDRLQPLPLAGTLLLLTEFVGCIWIAIKRHQPKTQFIPA